MTTSENDTDPISEPERVVRGFLHAWQTDGFVPTDENGVITRYSDYFDPGPFFAMIEQRARTSAK